ncbi:hypothetical protein Dip510_001290 [Elusimicrobium posterum]|uniref:alpha/beta hydrolase n=1 Tax=Elusimicrobium posterum TaxID=3116653 RepID=UPI003C72053A
MTKYITALILFILLVFVLDRAGAKLMYHPVAETPQKVFPFEDVYIPNGKHNIHAWYMPAPAKDKPVILFVSGNAGNTGYFQAPAAIAKEMRYGILIFDYPSFGHSGGKITQKNLFNAAQKCLDYLTDTQNISKDKIIIWGYSLGGAVAAHTAANNKVGAVILHSTFTNMADMGIYVFTGKYNPQSIWQKIFTPFLYLVTANKLYNNKKYVKQISSPLLITYSLEDEVVPAVVTAELVRDYAPKGTETYVSPTGAHTDFIWAFPGILSFLEKQAK